MTTKVCAELRAVYSVDEAAVVLGIGRNLAYTGVHEGWLPAIRVGRRLLVPRKALEDLLANPRGMQARPNHAPNPQ